MPLEDVEPQRVIGVSGVKPARLAEIGQRQREKPVVEISKAAVEVGIVILGIALDGRIVVDDDLVEIALGPVFGAAVEGSIGVFGIEPDRLDVVGKGALGVGRRAMRVVAEDATLRRFAPSLNDVGIERVSRDALGDAVIKGHGVYDRFS